MKLSTKLSAKALVLASAFIFGAVGVVHANDQKDTMDIPPGDMDPGISGRASAYDKDEDRQGTRGDRGSGDYSQGGANDRDGHDKKDLYQGSGTDGTGPKLEGRY